MVFMTLYAFRIISVHKTLNFMHFLQKRDIRTDGPTDGRTDRRRTDTPSYRDARTHLKTMCVAPPRPVPLLMLAGHRRVVEDLGPTPFLIIGLKDLGARVSLESYHLRVEAHLGGIYVQVNATWTE